MYGHFIICCRYVVWSKIFEAWRLYVLYQKATAEKMELATAISTYHNDAWKDWDTATVNIVYT